MYGYARDTTPRLRGLRNELFIFNRVTSNATNTIQSLPLALSRADTTNMNRFRSERSIVGLLTQAGFETSWISNQERSRSFDNPITQIALEAGNVSFPDAVSGGATGDRFDSNLLGRLDDQLSRSSNSTKVAIFLHMEGSHFSYRDRYPAGADRFPDADHPPRPLSKRKAQLVNEYDNTIYFTDYILQQIITRLQHCECQAGLLFFSDHGERLFDSGSEDDDFGHGYPTVTQAEIEIPFFIFLSKDYQMHNPALVDTLRMHANAVATLHNVFETIVDLSGATYDGRSSELSLFSKSFREPTSLSVLDVNENAVSFPVQEYPSQPRK
jgi:heptose-I-phosphate ethanolaminephosphotransferase